MINIKDVFKKPKVYFFLLIFILYLILDLIVSGFYNTIPLILIYFKTVNWIKLGLSLILTLIIGFLISTNTVLIYLKYKERQKCNGVGATSIGAVGGLIVGVCPLCVTGIIPLLFGLFGITFSLAILPFEGIELQALVAIILSVGLFNLNKRNL